MRDGQVLLWNASVLFREDNRDPLADALDASRGVLERLRHGRTAYALGRHAERATGAPYVRHPSMAGAPGFIAGLRVVFGSPPGTDIRARCGTSSEQAGQAAPTESGTVGESGPPSGCRRGAVEREVVVEAGPPVPEQGPLRPVAPVQRGGCGTPSAGIAAARSVPSEAPAPAGRHRRVASPVSGMGPGPPRRRSGSQGGREHGRSGCGGPVAEVVGDDDRDEDDDLVVVVSLRGSSMKATIGPDHRGVLGVQDPQRHAGVPARPLPLELLGPVSPSSPWSMTTETATTSWPRDSASEMACRVRRDTLVDRDDHQGPLARRLGRARTDAELPPARP